MLEESNRSTVTQDAGGQTAPLELGRFTQLLLGVWLTHSSCSGLMRAGSSAISSERGPHVGRHGGQEGLKVLMQPPSVTRSLLSPAAIILAYRLSGSFFRTPSLTATL